MRQRLCPGLQGLQVLNPLCSNKKTAYWSKKVLTSRERLLKTLRGELPDCVPVAPDFSNMIPARLTGKPFWDLYLYNDPPIHEAYIACAKHFDIDSLMDGYFQVDLPELRPANALPRETFIVFRDEDRIVTQASWMDNGKRNWAKTVNVYYRADPPSWGVLPEKINLPEIPGRWEPVEGAKQVDRSPEGFNKVKQMLGNQGLIGLFVTSSCALGNEADIFNYYDHPELHEKWAEERVEQAERKFRAIMAMETKPDFLCVGGSGTLVFQTVEIFRQLALPAVKRVIELATAAGMPTHIHSCGPERELVEIMAEETSLTVIDPLEIAPMGNCDLA